MLLMYEGDGEVLICEVEQEATLVEEYFEQGGRDIDLYDRSLVDGAICISSREPRVEVDCKIAV